LLIYVYDGSFKGLLSSLYRGFKTDENPSEITSSKETLHPLSSRRIEIETDPDKARQVYSGIKRAISARATKNVKYCYLSEQPGVGRVIFSYLKLGFRVGGSLDDRLDEGPVFEVQQLARKVSKERHRMTGLVRFREIGNSIYYSPIEPDYNIVGLLAPHFRSRMSDQNWIIHDLNRNLGAMYNTEEWVLTHLQESNLPSESQGEEFYQNLWCSYFDSASFPGRKNRDLQRKYMPRRCWKHLVEID